MLNKKNIVIFSMAINMLLTDTALSQVHVTDHLGVTENAELTLSAVIDHVVMQSPSLGIAVAKDNLSKAYKTKAENLFAASPEISFTYQNDTLASDIGQREWEGNIKAPIWLPGERASFKKAARHSKAQANLYRAKLRWEIAGKVREYLWNIKIAENDFVASQNAVAVISALKAKIEIATRLGDQPQNDLLLISQEVIRQQMDEKKAERAYVDSLLEYKIFTGLSEIPVHISEQQAIVEGDPETPNVLFLQSTVNFYQAQYQAILKQWPSAPSLSLGMKKSRGNYMTTTNNTLNFNLTIPIGGKSYKAKDRAEARQRLAISERNYQQTLREQALANHDVEHELEVCEFQLKASQVYHSQALATKNNVQKAYDLGESGLLDFLRIQEKYLESNRQFTYQKLYCGQTVAQYNQVKGILPQ